MALEAGEKALGRYIVEGVLGKGAMGEVYLAKHELLDMPVAVKVSLTADSDDLRERFEREAKLMARVRHTNVVQILDYGFLSGGEPCIVMEFLDGKELADAKKPAPWRLAIDCVSQILEGLEAVHAAGVLHRDLKPSNVVMVGERGRVAKLVDFGIVRPESRGEMRLTQTGMLIGTPAFMSPEQLLGLDDITSATDVYAAGLILYELLQGSLPFGDSMNAIMKRLRHDIPAPMASSNAKKWPAALTDVLLEMLAAEPGDRPTPRKARQRLRDISQIEPLSPKFAGAGVVRPATPAAGMLRPSSKGRIKRPKMPEAGSSSEPVRSGSTRLMHQVATAETLTATPVPENTRETAAPPQGYDSWPSQLDEGEERSRALVAAKLPSSRLRAREERQWLSGLLDRDGRGFTMGAQLWIAIVKGRQDEAALERARGVVSSIEERYGHLGESTCGLVGEDFSLTGATLSGAAPLPSELADLIADLHG